MDPTGWACKAFGPGETEGRTWILKDAADAIYHLGLVHGACLGAIAVLAVIVGLILAVQVGRRFPRRCRSCGLPALLLLAALAVFTSSARAQQPDRRGEVALDQPEYQGVRASAPIPKELHAKNEGGSDGSGLCVVASLRINGRYQRVPGVEALWAEAKKRPGGYYPEKLEKLVGEVMPQEKWASYVGTDPTVLDSWSRRGYPIGATMNTGALYGYQPIHHMISLAHYRKGQLACVVDNNDPGKFHWMPAAEYDRRWIDAGEGWAFIWTRRVGGKSAAVVIIFCAAGVVALGPLLRPRA